VTGSLDPFLLTGVILDGKYRVDAFVAEGGFGAVYAGHHLRLDIPLAIKLLKTDPMLSAEARAQVVSRFLVEARTTARLAHPNITRARDTGVLHTAERPEGVPWIALEWLDGRTLESDLDDRVGQGGRTPQETMDLLGPVIDAIAYAHARGVIHRDLKPSNVMLVKERDRIVARVLDFGIAKLAEGAPVPPSGQTTTESSVVAFSPGYAAPEQVSRARTGPWTDVHALGLLLTEVLTDEPPYEAQDGIQVLSSILSPTRPTPARRGFVVGPWEDVIRRAVALSPRDRYNDASELLRDLTQSLDAAQAAASSAPKPTVRVPPSEHSGSVPPATEREEVASRPPASTTMVASSGAPPGATPAPPGTTTIAIGLGLTAVLMGGALLALGSFRSSHDAAPTPSGVEVVALPRGAADGGRRPPANTLAPAASSAAAIPPLASEHMADEEDLRLRTPRSHHKEPTSKPPHDVVVAPAASRERLTPTSSFE
jgi:serine/threonine protein kinase